MRPNPLLAIALSLAACSAPNAPVSKISTFVADPSLVLAGVQSNVTWTWTPSGGTCQISPQVGELLNGDRKAVTLAQDTTFTLSCTSTAGTRTAQTVDKTTAPVGTWEPLPDGGPGRAWLRWPL